MIGVHVLECRSLIQVLGEIKLSQRVETSLIQGGKGKGIESLGIRFDGVCVLMVVCVEVGGMCVGSTRCSAWRKVGERVVSFRLRHRIWVWKRCGAFENIQRFEIL